MTYIFGAEGLQGGGTCPAEQNWRDCLVQAGGGNALKSVPQVCTATIDLRALPAWEPSVDDARKQQVATELRNEIAAQWKGATEIVIRDFNFKDPQLTAYFKLADGDYVQGCSFHATEKPHCTAWHSFGQVPNASIRQWIFEKPYRLK
jgi:hypothetical protein